MRQPTLVLILESHRRFAERVRLLLAVDESIQIVGSTSSAEKALALAARYRPDVFLVDLDIRGVDYVEVIRGFREMQPEARVLVMSASGERGAIRRAMNAGASGSIRIASAGPSFPPRPNLTSSSAKDRPPGRPPRAQARAMGPGRAGPGRPPAGPAGAHDEQGTRGPGAPRPGQVDSGGGRHFGSQRADHPRPREACPSQARSALQVGSSGVRPSSRADSD